MENEPPIDHEDIIEGACYIVFCIASDGKLFPDRVYRNLQSAKKRQSFLQSMSLERGMWHITQSELGN